MSLDEWGWDEQWAQQVAVHGVDSTGVARVVSQDRASWPLQTQSGPENTRLRSASGAGNEEQVLAANVDKFIEDLLQLGRHAAEIDRGSGNDSIRR